MLEKPSEPTATQGRMQFYRSVNHLLGYMSVQCSLAAHHIYVTKASLSLVWNVCNGPWIYKHTKQLYNVSDSFPTCRNCCCVPKDLLAVLPMHLIAGVWGCLCCSDWWWLMWFAQVTSDTGLSQIMQQKAANPVTGFCSPHEIPACWPI